ncbi:MAG: HEAT repeat domain-containing protein [Acidobacteria bacterium]|nr:HEAT repeat domain-containing protein [Acidobacteriota bacterium]
MIRSVLISLIGVALYAQQPPIQNAKLETIGVTSGLDAAVRSAAGKQSGPAWIGYAVSRVPGRGESCCWNNDNRGCGLEGNRNLQITAQRPTVVQLEGPTHMTILYRAEGGVIGKIRAFTVDCPLDAGGLPLYWLNGVKNAESVAMLTRMVNEDAASDRRKSSRDGALHAIAMHAGPEAFAAVDNLASNSQSVETRKSAIFWLAQTRGREGFQTVDRLVRSDPSPKVREHAVFALTQSSEPGAIPSVLRVAKEDKDAHVRGQALFWLAQRASKQQASAAITDALEKDPNTEVKKKAVFALTQMPQGEGVPMLIQVARSNPNAEVRKQAMFWLGQSKDARALRFFEEVLTK